MHMHRSRKKRALTMRNLQHVGVDLRVVLLVRNHGACWYCGTPLTLATMTADHVVPVKHGGTAVLDNLVASCKACNEEKGHKTIEAFRMISGVDLFWGERRCRLLTTRSL